MGVEYKYVIVGAGMSAHSAARGIRERDPAGSILMIGQEPDSPYDRPPLTKDLWKGDKTLADIDLHTAEKTDAEIWTGVRATSLNPDTHTLITDDGRTINYEKLLLATGGSPHTISQPSDRVIYFRTKHDYELLRALAQPGTSIAVLGGGFIGLEIAAGLALAGAQVTLIISDDSPGSLVYPPGLCGVISQKFADHDVRVLTGRIASEIQEEKDKVNIYFDAHPAVHVDGVVAGFGITPNNALALDGGLPTEAGGVVVDAMLRTSDSDVFAAGDVAYYPDDILGRRRIEHVDNAQSMGKTAGHNMVRADERYVHTPYFYSDIFDLGYEAVGRLSSQLDMVEDWAPGKTNKTGVVYYLEDRAVVGVLLWNVWDSTDLAREVLKEFGEPGSVGNPAKQLKGQIPTR